MLTAGKAIKYLLYSDDNPKTITASHIPTLLGTSHHIKNRLISHSSLLIAELHKLCCSGEGGWKSRTCAVVAERIGESDRLPREEDGYLGKHVLCVY